MESDSIRQINTMLKCINGVSIQVVKKKTLKYTLLQ